MLGEKRVLAPLAIAILLLSACAKDDEQSISQRLTTEFDASTSAPIDLAKLGPSTWQKVCILGPYTSDKEAEQILGFKWNSKQKSSITQNDGINLLIFVKEQKVLAYAEHPRDKGDFSELRSKCLTRQQSILSRQPVSDGFVQLVNR